MDKNKIKVALILNAFVLPGFGYFFIGRKIKGALVTVATLFVFVAAIFEYGAAFVRTIQASPYFSGDVTIIIDALAGAWGMVKVRILLYLLALIVLWVYGIVDVMIFKKRSSPI